jgi:hypothetical protein
MMVSGDVSARENGMFGIGQHTLVREVFGSIAPSSACTRILVLYVAFDLPKGYVPH